MSLVKKLKSAIIFLMIGSSVIWVSPVVKKTINTFQNTPEDQIQEELGIKLDKYEVIFWVTILLVLSTSVLLCVWIFSKFSIKPFYEYLTEIYGSKAYPIGIQ